MKVKVISLPYFPGFVCFVLNKATVSGERLQDHWSSGLHIYSILNIDNFRPMHIVTCMLFIFLFIIDILFTYFLSDLDIDSKQVVYICFKILLEE